MQLSKIFLQGVSAGAVAVALSFGGQAAQAATVVLDSSTQCSENNAINGISIGDVTGNSGGADDCWGTFDNNDPGPGGAFQIGSMEFNFLSRFNVGGAIDGEDIGLDLPVNNGSSGTWSRDDVDIGDFLIVLKAANTPGFAAWLFEGDSNDSFFGDWLVAWTNDKGEPRDLSHLSIYSKGVTPIPLPAAGFLLIGALGGLGLAARRRRKSA